MAASPTAKPTEEKSCFDILHAKGIFVEPGEQTLTTRIGSVKYALNTMRLGLPIAIVHSRCRKLRRGYQGRYQYRKVRIAGTQERFAGLEIGSYPFFRPWGPGSTIVFRGTDPAEIDQAVAALYELAAELGAETKDVDAG